MMVDTDAAQSPNAKSLAASLDALFAPWDRTDAPGLVVGVARGGQVLYRRGFGMASLEFDVAVTPATRMRIGSTSKHFTALLALLLAEDGKLSIDAPIRTYIPELTGPSGDPTLRQLMQHTGGSRCHLDLGFLAHGLAAPAKGFALATHVRQAGCNFAPGEAMIYSNGGYFLLSLAIERVGGAPFEQQLMDRLFVPVGLTETASIPSDLQITPGMATLHAPWPDGGWRRGLFPSHELLGEGAIVSTLDDMLRWTAHLRSRDKLGAPGSWAELVKPPTFANGALGEYALGLILRNYRGLRTIHHPGGVIGGSSQMMTVPDHDLDIIILANGAPGANPPRLAEQVIDIVLADLIGDAPSMISAADYQPLLGDWQSLETGLIYSLRDVEGRLCLELCKAWLFALPLVRKGNEVMAVSDSLGPVKVDLDRALATGELIITFGGRSTAYAHGVKTTSDQAVFASAVAGHFSSADAGADLTIKPLGDRLVVRISDGYGVVECDLICASDRLGYFAAPPPAIWFWSILRFNIVDGAATGFQLNSVRTRNLEFKRVEDWSRP